MTEHTRLVERTWRSVNLIDKFPRNSSVRVDVRPFPVKSKSLTGCRRKKSSWQRSRKLDAAKQQDIQFKPLFMPICEYLPQYSEFVAKPRVVPLIAHPTYPQN
ncbi:hypothetical protein [Leptolyngbya sp. NIES-2104]|uniref:hypothetical protein n=1 Tax=Leptolyngbya sp. NIES-2104 TaxID=1552121 RepID=UPI00178CE6F4|nr:hypothetical protein [Leptolyngbya sp. NIES-2104]